jgi:hypothetical protein
LNRLSPKNTYKEREINKVSLLKPEKREKEIFLQKKGMFHFIAKVGYTF